MMPLLFPIVLALSWVMMPSLPTLHGAVFRSGVPPALDFSVSPGSLTLDLLATQSPPWSEEPDAADKKSPDSREKTPAPMTLAMWFGVLGAALLILPRLRRR
jgi:hypothetical protein